MGPSSAPDWDCPTAAAAQSAPSPYGAPQSQPSPYAAPQSAPSPYGAPHGGAGAQQGTGYPGPDQGAPFSAPHAAYADPGAGAGAWAPAPPADIKGVYDGPLNGTPLSASDEKLWGMLAHLSAVLGYVIGAGFLGWVGPLIIFLVFKDRSRFARYNAAESLNAAIATVIAEIVLGTALGIFAIVTLGLGSIALPLMFLPALLHFIFAIIGAVKANQGTWYNYPLNIRFIR